MTKVVAAKNAQTDQCHRCGGLMLEERVFEIGSINWRCVSCGERIDPVILAHRQKDLARVEAEIEAGRVRPRTLLLHAQVLVARGDLAHAEELAAATKLTYSTDLRDIADCNVYIVTVPTPIDTYKRPDMSALRAASRTIGEVIKRGDVVVYAEAEPDAERRGGRGQARGERRSQEGHDELACGGRR